MKFAQILSFCTLYKQKLWSPVSNLWTPGEVVRSGQSREIPPTFWMCSHLLMDGWIQHFIEKLAIVCEDLFHAKSQSQVVVNGCGRGGVAVLPVLPCGPRTQIQNSYNTEQSPHSSAQSQYTILHIIALVYAHIVGLNSFLIREPVKKRFSGFCPLRGYPPPYPR